MHMYCKICEEPFAVLILMFSHFQTRFPFFLFLYSHIKITMK